MAKYLIEARYTVDGARGLMKDGGTGRRTAAEELIKSIDDWLQAHPELAKIPRIAKAYSELRQAALKEIEARQS